MPRLKFCTIVVNVIPHETASVPLYWYDWSILKNFSFRHWPNARKLFVFGQCSINTQKTLHRRGACENDLVKLGQIGNRFQFLKHRFVNNKIEKRNIIFTHKLY